MKCPSFLIKHWFWFGVESEPITTDFGALSRSTSKPMNNQKPCRFSSGTVAPMSSYLSHYSLLVWNGSISLVHTGAVTVSSPRLKTGSSPLQWRQLVTPVQDVTSATLQQSSEIHRWQNLIRVTPSARIHSWRRQ